MDFQIKYLSWKTKVDSYVKYLTGLEIYEYDNVKQFYNSGFDDKIVALIISRDIIDKKKYDKEEWWNDLNKVFSIFDIQINKIIKEKIIKKNFPVPPLNTACVIMQDYGYLSLSLFSNDNENKINDSHTL
jgi:hypothetical protein